MLLPLALILAAPPGVVVAHSPSASRQYIGSPSIAVLPDGTYAVSHDFFGPGSTRDTTVVYTSADKGATWTEPTSAKTGLLLADGTYHCAPVPVTPHAGRLWRGMEQYDGPKWGAFRPFMMSIPADADLLDAASWTSTNRLARDPKWLGGTFAAWLEGNAVVTPDGRVVDVLRVDQPDFAERAAVVRVSADGKTATFDPADFVVLPGGSKKFTIRYDPTSKRYWALANEIPTEHRVAGRRPAQVRNTLSLVSSADLRAWEVRRVVLGDADATGVGFQYADWLFDGEDIVAAVRTAVVDAAGVPAHDPHDANHLTVHRVAGFRR